ncbi:Ku protein [Streptomyces massasporeus]|uniref:Ku protein n=1 Tax=Streptomyces massasporeus TaxID=67324 RepID=UPI003456BD00
MGRVRVRKFCEVEDREVRTDEIGKGYQPTKEQVIPISDDESRDLPLPTAKAIEIEAFVPLQSVDPIRIGEGYYLKPSGQDWGPRAVPTGDHSGLGGEDGEALTVQLIM